MAHAAHGPHSGRLGVQPDKRKLSTPHIIHQRPCAGNRTGGEGVLFASLLLENFLGCKTGMPPESVLAGLCGRVSNFLPDARSPGKGSQTRRARGWLGGRDSNPDSAVQSRVSYH